MLSSNKESIKYLKKLGAKKIKYIGNLKFSQSEKNNELKKFKKFFNQKELVCI